MEAVKFVSQMEYPMLENNEVELTRMLVRSRLARGRRIASV